MQQKREFKDTEHLFAKVDALVDPVLQTIPERPRFCFNSAKQLRLFDSSTLEGMRDSIRDYRSLMDIIDTSGPTGIGYILTALPDNNDQAVSAGDRLLKAWHTKFPKATYLNAAGERERQLILHFHEHKLTAIDKLFDQWVWNSLPEEVRQIHALEEQLRECQDDLINPVMNENDIQTGILQLQEQLDAAKTIRDGLNLDEIKGLALVQAQVAVAMAVADKDEWSTLLNFDPEDSKHILDVEQFTALVCQAVDALKARNFSRLGKDELGPIAKHLAARRALQNEKRSNAEGSLRTQATVKGEIHPLSLSEVRDPLNPTFFIDTSTSSCAKKFRDIVVGACLSLGQTLPAVIKEFIDQKEETDADYVEKAKKTYHQYRRKKLKLPKEQMEVLSGFGLNYLPPSAEAKGISSKLERFGLLKRTRDLNPGHYESTKSARF